MTKWLGEIKGEKISEGIFNSSILNSPNHITNPKYFTIDSPRVSDLVRFFEDRANLK